MKPLVSILIPAFNAEKTIAETLASAIGQTWPRKEIIVVDDGSTDHTVAIANGLPSSIVKIVTLRHQGAAGARNTAFSLSHGDYVQWLDADDLLGPDKIERQMLMLDRYPSKRMLLSSAWGEFTYRQSRARFVPTALWDDLAPLEWLVHRMEERDVYMQTATWLVSRELTEAAGPWDTRLSVDDDGEYFCRVLLQCEAVRFVRDARVFYRVSGVNSLGYIGRSHGKMEAKFRSMQLQIDHLRSLEDSERVRAACIQYLQNSLEIFYPDRLDIVQQAERMAADLGGQLAPPRFSWKYSWIGVLVGQNTARRAQFFFPRIRLALERLWEKALYPLEPRSAPAASLIDRTTRAAEWRLAGTVVGAVCQFAVGVLLARLLTPTDFGVMALAFVVLGLAHALSDLGIGNAVVQRAGLTDRHVRTAFTFSVLLGFAMTAAMVVAAPLGAAVVRDPKVTSILRVLSAGFAVGGTAVVARALLRRQLDFRRQFFIDSSTYMVAYGGLAVILALLGYGVWSLVWGSLLQGLLASSAQLAAVRHSVRPLLARRELSELLHFGLGAHASAFVNYLALNCDNFIVGRWMGAANLGFYSRAYTMMNVPYTYTASVMSSVLLPAFAQVQGQQPRLRRAYLVVTQLSAMVAAPSMAVMAIAAPHLVRTVYGPQWTGVVIPLQILCMAGYFRSLYHLGGVVAQSVGRVYSELWRQAFYAALVIGGALVGSRYGLAGVAAGVSVAILYMFVAMAQLALRASGTAWHDYLRVQAGALVTAVITGSVVLSIRLLLEAYQASSAAITLAIVTGGAVPWSIGVLWTLGEPDLEPLRARLPAFCVRLVVALRKGRRTFAGLPIG